MPGVNLVILLGRVGKDPEMRYTQSGSAICNFSLATSEEWKDKGSGEKKTKTEWHKVIVFGKLAEIAGRYLVKGSQCYIEGKIQTREWTDKNQEKRYTTEIVASEVQFLGGKTEKTDEYTSRGQNGTPTGKYDENDDSDVPF